MMTTLIVLVISGILYGLGFKSGHQEGYKDAHIDIVDELRKEMS